MKQTEDNKPKAWRLASPTGLFPHQQRTVFETPHKPLLYDAKGNPLCYRRPLGFRPEDAK